MAEELTTWNIKTLLKWAEDTTNEFQKQMGIWGIYEQINHTHSEVSEFYEGLRKNKGKENAIEEIWDIIFSALTCKSILKISDKDMIFGFNKVVRKINKRITENHYAKLIESVKNG